MTICGADNTFNTLHETSQTHEIHETCRTHETHKTSYKNPAEIPESPHEIHKTTPKTHETRRSIALSKPWYSPRSSHHIDMADCTRKMNRELTLLDNLIVTKHTGAAKNLTKDIISAARRTIDISMIGAAPFNYLVQHSQSQKGSGIQIFSVTLRDINIALAPKKHTNPATKLPTEYHEFLDVFSRTNADVLPKHRPQYNHTIELIEGKAPTWGPLYSMSANELKVLKAYIEKMIDKGFIRASFSSAVSPMLFAKKLGGRLRFCVDY